MLVEGQIVGGVAQGIGGALFEEFIYDDRGEPLSVTFADYLMPTAREVPALDVIISEDAPSPLNPMGLKGAGEGGANAVGAAIAAAIDDAHRHAGRGDAVAGHAAAVAGVAGRAVITAVAVGRHKRQRRLFAQAALPKHNAPRRGISQQVCSTLVSQSSNERFKFALDPDVRGRATPPRKAGVNHN